MPTAVYSSSSASDRSVELDESLAFTFKGVAAEVRYDLSCDPLIYEPTSVENLYVAPGEETVIDLPVLLGVNVEGRVVDETGTPISCADVEALTEVKENAPTRWRRTTTAQDGAFSFAGLPPGSTTLSVHAHGYRSLQHELGGCGRGVELANVELRLGRGSSIGGRVLWPDGSPAEGAEVTAEGSAFKTDVAGAFLITGLELGRHRITARTTNTETVTLGCGVFTQRQKAVRATLKATLEGVEAGTSDLVLQLSDGSTLSGVVVDDLGAPVDGFQVSYGVMVSAPSYSQTRDDAFRTFEGGAFALEGLEPGTYELSVSAVGYLPAPDLHVEVPAESPLTIELTRGCRIAGVVQSPSGAPAAQALVEATSSTSAPTLSPKGWVRSVDHAYQVMTDKEGRFSLATGNGSVEVWASHAGTSPSEPQELTLAPGGSVEHVTLQLRAGATLSGLVLDADGKGLARQEVEVQLEDAWTSFAATARSDEGGHFAFCGLRTGNYLVVARPSAAELAELGLPAGEGASSPVACKVRVELGEAGAEVVLAVPSFRPVRVHGTVTASHKPAQARLWIDAGDEDVVAAETDANGSYEALVAPGAHLFVIHLDGAGSIRQEVSIQGPGEQQVDLEVPLGSLSGRVHGPGGPVSGIAVELYLQNSEGGSPGWGYSTAQTDDSGRYAIEQLPAGTWSIQAGGNPWGRLVGPDAPPVPYTLAKVEGVAVLSGEDVRDVDLHVLGAGVVSGRVLTAEGKPAHGARIRARLPSGQLADPYCFSPCGPEGDFKLDGLAPGEHVLGATYGPNQGAEQTVTVEAGREARVEVHLAAATLVRVAVRGGAGAPAAAGLTCRRSDGRDYTTWFTDPSPDTPWLSGSSPEPTPAQEELLGLLPSGTYTLAATSGGAGRVSKTVTLAGEPELRVELGL